MPYRDKAAKAANGQRYNRENRATISVKRAASYQRNRGKVRARQHHYNATRAEENTKRATEWVKANPERRSEYYKKWYAQRRDARLLAIKQWRHSNPDKAKALSTIARLNRRALKQNAAGSFTYEGWMAKVEYHGWKCRYCKTSLTPSTLTIDHVIALSVKGTNWLSNLAPACKSCNCSKGSQQVSAFKAAVNFKQRVIAMSETKQINSSHVHGEPSTGFEPRVVDGVDHGPFECGNCGYFDAKTVSCRQSDMMKSSKLPKLPNGQIEVRSPEDCCEYVERKTAKASPKGFGSRLGR